MEPFIVGVKSSWDPETETYTKRGIAVDKTDTVVEVPVLDEAGNHVKNEEGHLLYRREIRRTLDVTWPEEDNSPENAPPALTSEPVENLASEGPPGFLDLVENSELLDEVRDIVALESRESPVEMVRRIRELFSDEGNGDSPETE